MKKLILIFATVFGFVAASFAQTTQNHPRDGFGLSVAGESADVSAWEEECKFSSDGETCTVTIRYTSDVYPVEFLQDDKVLETVYSKEAEIGFQVVEGVEYEKLPEGGYSYSIEVKNPRGRTYVSKRVGG